MSDIDRIPADHELGLPTAEEEAAAIEAAAAQREADLIESEAVLAKALADTDDDATAKTEATAKADPEAASKAKDDDAKPRKGTAQARISELAEERNAASERAERAERELAALKAAPKSATAVDFKARVKEAAEALAEGDYDKHAELMESIESERMTLAEEKAFARAEAAALERENKRESARAQAKVEEAAEDIAARYPFFDSRRADHDPVGLQNVIDHARVLSARGVAPHRALEQAADMFAKIHAPDDFVFATEKAAAAAASADPKASAKKLQAERDRAALKTAIAAAEATPPGGGIGSRGIADIDVSKLSPEQWAQLPAAKRDEYLMRSGMLN